MYQSKFAEKSDSAADRKKLLIVAICLAVALVIVGCAVWFFSTHVIVDSKIYSKTEQILDLRGEGVAVEHYEALREKLPGHLIYWDVPFQDGYYSNDTKELTITALSDEDTERLAYFPGLQTIHAEDCEDFSQLMKLQEAYPGISLLYTVAIDGTDYAQDAEELTVARLTDEEVALTDYLPKLKTVHAEECMDYAQLAALQARRPDCAVRYSVVIGEEAYALDTRSLNLTNQNLAELLDRLAYLPEMKTVHLVDPLGDAATMTALLETYPNVSITSELVGVVVSEDGKEVDLSAIALTNIEDVDKYMAFYPDAERVYLGMPEIDNDTIAAFRDTKRQDYKVVWTVMCGTIPVRTDETYFQPIQQYVYYFFDEDTYNLRYCEDMICIDLGHMSLHDCSWVEGMPNLQYLVLSWTFIEDITPLSTCKNLIWLELYNMPIKDLSPLVGCTALQDLELGKTDGDRTIIAKMPWLKNLYWQGTGYNDLLMLQEALPDTNVNVYGSGWRKLPNYYAHRDILGMHYMD